MQIETDATDGLAAIEWDFRQSLIRELRRVAKTGDDRFFRLDQPRAVNGRPTVLGLAQEVMELRSTLMGRLPPGPSVAIAFLLSCLKWSHAAPAGSVSSAVLARNLLASLEANDNA